MDQPTHRMEILLTDLIINWELTKRFYEVAKREGIKRGASPLRLLILLLWSCHFVCVRNGLWFDRQTSHDKYFNWPSQKRHQCTFGVYLSLQNHCDVILFFFFFFFSINSGYFLRERFSPFFPLFLNPKPIDAQTNKTQIRNALKSQSHSMFGNYCNVLLLGVCVCVEFEFPESAVAK